MQKLLPLVQQLQDTLVRVVHNEIGIENKELVKQFCAAGAALISLPTHMMCNNPACSNVSGPSELQLVTGSSSACGGCRTARY